MAQKLRAPLPPGLELGPGYTLEYAAVDPSSGAAVTGVSVSSAYLVVTQLSPGLPADLESGPFMLVPGPGE